MSSPDGNGNMQPPPIGVCCRECETAALVSVSGMQRAMSRAFIVCTTCGNKRCPKATNHELECTGSNASGQKGSWYE